MKLRFENELVSFEEDGEGVRARVRDIQRAEDFDIHAKYMVAGDGGRSPVATALKLPMQGEAGMGTAINVLFEADLAKYVAHRPGSLYSIFDHGYDEITGGYATLRMVRPWTQWLAMFPEVAAGDKHVEMNDELAHRIITGMIGVEESRGTGVCVDRSGYTSAGNWPGFAGEGPLWRLGSIIRGRGQWLRAGAPGSTCGLAL